MEGFRERFKIYMAIMRNSATLAHYAAKLCSVYEDLCFQKGFCCVPNVSGVVYFPNAISDYNLSCHFCENLSLQGARHDRGQMCKIRVYLLFVICQHCHNCFFLLFA